METNLLTDCILPLLRELRQQEHVTAPFTFTAISANGIILLGKSTGDLQETTINLSEDPTEALQFPFILTVVDREGLPLIARLTADEVLLLASPQWEEICDLPSSESKDEQGH
jgi:hypothetical protein